MSKGFDYKGLSEKELEDLCSDQLAVKRRRVVYWTSEAYSFGEHYRNYGYYPSFLPLPVYSDHGVGGKLDAFKHELENDAPVFFVFNEKKYKNYKKQSKKPCYITIPPLLWYRKRSKIEQSKNAKGTIAFPSHSTPEINACFSVRKYIEELKSLPEDMQPVCVCLHMHDINKGQHKMFLENNIPVYTAGNAFDIRYAQRFYDILRNFKYSCSNLVGSYTYYSVEMEIPFSLFGESCEYINKADTNLEYGIYNYKNKDYQLEEKIFLGIHKEITLQQKQLVENSTNSPKAISRFKMAIILWLSYFKYKIRKVIK